MISPHETFLRSAGTVSPETTGFPFCRLLRLPGITWEVFLPASTRGIYIYIYAHIQTRPDTRILRKWEAGTIFIERCLLKYILNVTNITKVRATAKLMGM
jgi:hypothetical protein